MIIRVVMVLSYDCCLNDILAKMDPHNSVPALQRTNKFGLMTRWIGGAVLGLVIGLILLILSETGYLPIITPIVTGQQDLFDTLFFYLTYDRYHNFDLIFALSISVYAGFWAGIGAMLLAGSKRFIVAGAILLVTYILAGIAWYILRVIWVISA